MDSSSLLSIQSSDEKKLRRVFGQLGTDCGEEFDDLKQLRMKPRLKIDGVIA